MFNIKNSQLTVSILDPVADVAKLGSRYCTGGYIWQITDAKKGPLLAGPYYPDPTPPLFDGQGAPEMFHRPVNPENIPLGGTVMCIGVGQVRRISAREPFDVRYNPDVVEFVKWQIAQESDCVVMETNHAVEAWAYRLVRTVSLKGRTVLSRTQISSTGQADLPIRWFPHPFFPLPKDNVLCDFSIPFSLPESPGYILGEDGFIHRKPEFNWVRGGCFQPLDFTPSTIGLTIVQKHDLVGEVTAVTDYDPSFLPIWGNQNTFSFEPYLERIVAPAESTVWEIGYTF